MHKLPIETMTQRTGFYDELHQLFDHFPTYHMKILLGCCKAKFGREDIFKPTTWKDHIVCIHQTLDKMQEYKVAMHQLYIDFKNIDDLFRRKVLNNIPIKFGITMKLVI